MLNFVVSVRRNKYNLLFVENIVFMKIIRRFDIGNILRKETVVDLYVVLTRLIFEWIKQAKSKNVLFK